MRSIAMQTLTNEMYARYPGMTIYGKGDKPHQAIVSDHNEDDTPGVRSAQSDPDTIPEHRAIDCMLGSVFTDAEAMWVINDIITRERKLPANQRKLRYINYKTTQWHTRNDYAPRDNSGDPHPTHVHFNGEAAQDDNRTQWLSTSTGVGIMFCKQDQPVGAGTVAVLQRQLNVVLAFINDPERLTVDDDYGNKTAGAMMRTGVGNPANNGSVYWEGEYFTLQGKLLAIAAAKAIQAHTTDAPHGGELPPTVTFTIPAQVVTAPLAQED